LFLKQKNLRGVVHSREDSIDSLFKVKFINSLKNINFLLNKKVLQKYYWLQILCITLF